MDGCGGDGREGEGGQDLEWDLGCQRRDLFWSL